MINTDLYNNKNPLSFSLNSLQGISENTALLLKKANIENLYDLLLRLPKKIIKQEESPGIQYMEDSHTYVALVQVIKLNIFETNKKRLEALVKDETGQLSIVFFGPAVNYAKIFLNNHKKLNIIGEVKVFLGKKQMIHPKLLPPKMDEIIVQNEASYHQVSGLPKNNYKKIVTKALEFLKKQDPIEHLSESALNKLKLNSLLDSFCKIHACKDLVNEDGRGDCPNYRRLAFEEILGFYVSILNERFMGSNNIAKIIPKKDISTLSKEILPFNLTASQEKVLDEIFDDMNQEKAMSRLLQGDVGSGKTAVSAISALNVVNAGYQVAIMAPTEILSDQLFKVFEGFFKNTRIKLCLLTSQTKTKERRKFLKDLLDGQINILIGTHALLTLDVEFKSLGLVIIDEQHKFGVKQRAALIKKAEMLQGFCPHLLVMTATPIPRSLALTVYGDLELSIIDERPPGRLAVKTKLMLGEILPNLLKLCIRIHETNQKAFIVFPLVEESEHLDLENATKAYAFLKSHFGDIVALIHGKMKPEEKSAAMKGFSKDGIHFLVATTVVEVGVDVPKATCIVIAHAERFGLAQLHQLRGRVGRGKEQSYCFLLSEISNQFSHAYQRLKALCQTDDGFLLAKKDLEIRGPGEFLGTRQSGLQNFLIFDHMTFADLISPAKRYAKIINKMDEKPTNLRHLLNPKKAHFS